MTTITFVKSQEERSLGRTQGRKTQDIDLCFHNCTHTYEYIHTLKCAQREGGERGNGKNVLKGMIFEMYKMSRDQIRRKGKQRGRGMQVSGRGVPNT